MTEIAPAQAVIAAPTEAELDQLRERARWVLDLALSEGASAAEVAISGGQGLSVTVRCDDIETLEFHRDRAVSVVVFLGQRKGVAGSTDLSDASLRDTVRAALAIAAHTGEDPHQGLADPSQLARDWPDLDLCHPWPLRAEDAVALARQCEQAGRQDPRIVNSEGASVSTGVHVRLYANSHGFLGVYPSSHHSVSCVLVAEQDGAMQRDYWYDSQRRADLLEPVERIGRRAAERTLSRLGAERPATGEYPVLFAPEVARGLIGHFVGAISGGSLYRKSSFLLDQLGQPVFPDWVQLHENPLLPGGAGSSPFDSDGLPTRAQHFVRDGVLVSYALGLYAARRLGMAPTGNGGGVRNLVMEPNAGDLDALCRQMGDGILITEVMGQGVNLITGDYSRGAAGFRVEDGRITTPLEEFTVAGRLQDMYATLQAAGSDLDCRGHIHCGSLLLAPLKVAGA